MRDIAIGELSARLLALTRKWCADELTADDEDEMEAIMAELERRNAN